MSGTIPGVTGNAQILLGYLSGALMHVGGHVYRIVEHDPAAGWLVLARKSSGNTYRVTVEQIGGVE